MQQKLTQSTEELVQVSENCHTACLQLDLALHRNF